MLRLKEVRKNARKTQQEVADFIGISQNNYSYWENEKVKIDNESLNKLAEYFNVSVDYLLGRADAPTLPQNAFDIFQYDNIHPVHLQKIRMLGEIACGVPIYADEDRESYVLSGTDIKADFCLKAKGDSMIGARIMDGDIVFCRAQEMVENGEIGVVIIGDEATLKRVYFYPEQKKLMLQAENPDYPPFMYVGEELNDIRILGKAIAFQSDIKSGKQKID